MPTEHACVWEFHTQTNSTHTCTYSNDCNFEDSLVKVVVNSVGHEPRRRRRSTTAGRAWVCPEICAKKIHTFAEKRAREIERFIKIACEATMFVLTWLLGSWATIVTLYFCSFILRICRSSSTLEKSSLLDRLSDCQLPVSMPWLDGRCWSHVRIAI